MKPIVLVPKHKLRILAKVTAEAFNQTYNPTCARTGAKYLRRNLKGPTIASYYGPTDFPSFKEYKKLFPDVTLYDDKEDHRLKKVAALKRRGKGAPPKKKAGPGGDKKKK
ncbi:mitochondrial 37S ribosomal protein mS33 ASCRUDRAFT_77276 [Ascoidea rubescens DSM 1968]|uniref:Small ribosomal subunit protein mS33 n=1 Tax=Ascoidea rubescens DSM 1968 TaxID=1344418 RepID=A0A1D2VC48_9ASCO|nr:hypothetical protein ASCRUDRAFT_77276 [Ascoidea rubescens DSM 1968]ODV59191.1 hypothetical protein ASCRUDRAFT_77276 [Ascoidea rubescens DSM 1968]